MSRNPLKRLLCWMSHCPDEEEISRASNTIQRMEAIPQRIDMMIERRRANIMEQAVIGRRFSTPGGEDQ